MLKTDRLSDGIGEGGSTSGAPGLQRTSFSGVLTFLSFSASAISAVMSSSEQPVDSGSRQYSSISAAVCARDTAHAETTWETACLHTTTWKVPAHRRLGVLLVLAREVERDVVDDRRQGILHSHPRRLEERPRLHVGTAQPGRHEAEGGARRVG